MVKYQFFQINPTYVTEICLKNTTKNYRPFSAKISMAKFLEVKDAESGVKLELFDENSPKMGKS